MLQQDLYGNYTNWEVIQAYLEEMGLLERDLLEQELVLIRQDPGYTFKNARYQFEQTVQLHLQSRMKAQRPERFWYPQISINDTRLRSKVYLESWDILGNGYDYCAVPDWLTELYREEVNQHRTIQVKFSLGTFLYSASVNAVYVVYDTSRIDTSQAEELEEGFDVFDAEGEYSFLRYPYTDEQRDSAKKIYDAHQGIVGSVEKSDHFGDEVAYPKFLLPGKCSTHVFNSYRKEKSVQLSYLYEHGYTFRGEDAEQKATTYLQQTYPNIRLVDWSEFEKLEEQRIF